jgi:ribonuclease III
MTNIIDKLKLPFRKDKELFSSLYNILGFYPRDIMLYKLALAHSSSALLTKGGKQINNERLEFLGDAIIEATTSDILYRHFEGKREGFLTTTRSKIVQRETLNKMAMEVGLDKLIRYNGRQSGHNSYIEGNAFEALVGAIYLDRGYRRSLWFMKQRIIAGHLNLESVAKKEVNFKSKLLEWAQRNRLKTEILCDEPAKNASTSETPAFKSTVVIEGVACGKGTGFSKKESHQNAARETLVMLNNDKQKIAEILGAKEKRTAMEAELVSVPPRVSSENADKRQHRQRRHSSGPQRAKTDRPQDAATANPEESNAATSAGNRRRRPRKPRNAQQQPSAQSAPQEKRSDSASQNEA